MLLEFLFLAQRHLEAIRTEPLVRALQLEQQLTLLPHCPGFQSPRDQGLFCADFADSLWLLRFFPQPKDVRLLPLWWAAALSGVSRHPQPKTSCWVTGIRVIVPCQKGMTPVSSHSNYSACLHESCRSITFIDGTMINCLSKTWTDTMFYPHCRTVLSTVQIIVFTQVTLKKILNI